MSWIRSIVREVLGLFVDDGSFAIAIVVWLGVAVLLLPLIAAHKHWAGPALFGGLAVILIESVMRFSRRRG
jgi:hypothetical protein